MLVHVEFVVLFLLQGAALGMWFVPLSGVLDAHGLRSIRPWAFATSALAAFVSPLIFGAMADRHASPIRVLCGLAFASAATLTLATLSIQFAAPPWAVLILIQAYAFCASPTWSVSSAVVLGRLADPKKQFGPIRAMATVGWMAGCCLISALHGDGSTLAGYCGAVTWLLVAAFSFTLPRVESPVMAGTPTWRERFGLDALQLLRHRDHRVVFTMTALFCIPLAAFYPYAPLHLRELGFTRTSAWMTLGQVTEVLSMFSLGALLLRWRLKWIFGLGLAFGVLRFALSALDTRPFLLLGVLLHGGSFALVFITAQIYLDQRVDPAWRARAQALLSLTNSGVGNLAGYLATGWWFSICTNAAGTYWPRFWSGLSIAALFVLFYFLAAYRGRAADLPTPGPIH